MQSLPGFAMTYKTLKIGSGAHVSKGDTVHVHATGVASQTNTKFKFANNQYRFANKRIILNHKLLFALTDSGLEQTRGGKQNISCVLSTTGERKSKY